jgi:hypothetical protein
VKDFFYIDIQNHLVKDIKVVDMMGRIKIVDFKNGYIDLRNLNSRYYMIMINRKDGKMQNLKIIKK